MAIEYGASSMLWMSKAVISQADPRYVKAAVCELLNELWNRDHVCVDEIFDRLVQVSTVGKYTPPDIAHETVEEALRMADELLDKSIDDEVKKFSEELDGLPEFNAEEHKKWLRDLGVPEEEEDENP